MRIVRLLSLLLLLFLSRLPAVAQQDSLLVQLERKWTHAQAYALKLAELMPAAFYDDKPMPEQMSFKEQLLHTAKNIEWLSTAYLFVARKPETDEKSLTSKEAVMAALSNAYDDGKLAHLTFPVQRLDEPVSFFAGPMTRRQILLLMHDHQTHHVGQLIVYLRLKGIRPPAYVGW